MERSRRLTLGLLLLYSLPQFACTSRKPEAIEIGRDACQHCKMIISDARFGGELLTAKGKARKFDAIECLLAYRNSSKESAPGDLLFVADSTHPGILLPAPAASFVIHPQLRSPMGLGILVGPTPESLKPFLPENQKEVLTWKELTQRLEKPKP